jgi:2-keto-4-pentenoate hydratase/2-oxohepta-3-ene-1,7-dioic acid hydratase in catechol pathway
MRTVSPASTVQDSVFKERPVRPFLFNKFNNTIVGPGDAVVRPTNCRALDWEAELV